MRSNQGGLSEEVRPGLDLKNKRWANRQGRKGIQGSWMCTGHWARVSQVPSENLGYSGVSGATVRGTLAGIEVGGGRSGRVLSATQHSLSVLLQATGNDRRASEQERNTILFVF